ncbi:hypothetical protein EH183_43115 [Streptomyces sp. CB01881]|uniref:hypothetical protein n=1 Tax=Streptomyces sp. CB01881 TaxID=2078691 RepID=UPI0011DF4509|nr:hypothetical protein [Streptomyces sp. CB01881]TYC66322.1 hypothetical protein EH183_43115 [Streptomyces sp. CB01881]
MRKNQAGPKALRSARGPLRGVVGELDIRCDHDGAQRAVQSLAVVKTGCEREVAGAAEVQVGVWLAVGEVQGLIPEFESALV